MQEAVGASGSICSLRVLPERISDILTVLSWFRFRKTAAGHNWLYLLPGPAVSDLLACVSKLQAHFTLSSSLSLFPEGLSNSPMGDPIHSWANLTPCHYGVISILLVHSVFYGNRASEQPFVPIPHPGSPQVGSKGAFTGPQNPWSFQAQHFIVHPAQSKPSPQTTQPGNLYSHPRAGPISSSTAASLAFSGARCLPTCLLLAKPANPTREELRMQPLQ